MPNIFSPVLKYSAATLQSNIRPGYTLIISPEMLINYILVTILFTIALEKNSCFFYCKKKKKN